MAKLYELTGAYAQILELAEADETDTWANSLAGLQDAIEEKAEAIAKVIRNLESDADAFQKEGRRLLDIAQTRKDRVNYLKGYLLAHIRACGLEKVKAGLFTVAVQDSPAKCDVLDETQVPRKFKRRVILEEVDRQAIIAHWKATRKQVKGAAVTQGQHLRIR